MNETIVVHIYGLDGVRRALHPTRNQTQGRTCFGVKFLIAKFAFVSRSHVAPSLRVLYQISNNNEEDASKRVGD